MNVPLGARVKDTITGFEGVATARTEYAHGTPSVRVTATDTGQDDEKERWIAEGRLEQSNGNDSRRTGFNAA